MPVSSLHNPCSHDALQVKGGAAAAKPGKKAYVPSAAVPSSVTMAKAPSAKCTALNADLK